MLLTHPPPRSTLFPYTTLFRSVNMQPVIDLRNRYKERFEKEHGVKLGFMSFFVKAAVHALKKFPVVNASKIGRHTSELQSRPHLVCRLLLEKKKTKPKTTNDAH